MLLNHFEPLSDAPKDAYLKSMQKKQILFRVMVMLSILMIAVAYLNTQFQFAPAAGENVLSFYYGLGFGLLAAGLAKLFLNRRILRNKTLYEQERRKHTDERNISICQKAMRAAGYTVLIASYIGMLVGGLFNSVILWCFWLVIMLYAFAYCIFSAYYRLHM